MITSLHIKNIGIIDELSINLNEGFTALTGETGAGKTLIIDSLNIISGARFSKEMIRTGQNYSLVEIVMYDENESLAEDGNIVVSREICDTGKNICKINGRFVTVSQLKDFMKKHIDIHGQFDNQIIMDESNHIRYLDSFCKGQIFEIKNNYTVLYDEYVKLCNKLKENFGDEKEKKRMLDLLNYEYNEIKVANLTIGEDDLLKEKYDQIKNSEKINEALNNSKDIIENNALLGLDEVIRNLSKINGYSSKYEKILNIVQDSYYNIQDANSEIVCELDKIQYDEEETLNILKRTDLICNLKRKYGSSIEEILDYFNELKIKIDTIENLNEINEKIKSRIDIIKKEMYDLALKMHNIRKSEALILEEKINQSFEDLEMKNAKLKIDISFEEDSRFDENGLDKIIFLICTNKGEEYKELSKIASGGEISRIVLAIKSILTGAEDGKTCIFDEIDTGISGKAALSVGNKIKNIAKNNQVICVTHLAQVAAHADHHYYISKEVKEEKTKTKINLLRNAEITNELARISSGNITEASISYALELQRQAI